MKGKAFSGGRLTRVLGRSVLKAMGWRIEGEFAAVNKMVVIAAPHTSNWDFIVGMAAKFQIGLKASWLGKHTLFFFPLGWLLKALGGVPVDRDAAAGTVDEVVRVFQQREVMVLALAPEGTRKRVEKWKTGFYHIAVRAGVPIVPVRIDYSTRTIAIGQMLQPNGDLKHDLHILSDYFEGAKGKHPDQFSLPKN